MGTRLNLQILFGGLAASEAMAKGAGKNIDATKALWLENLPEEATWTDLMELGQQVGAPTWAEKTSECRCYLLFETAYQATTAMEALHGAFVGHNEIEVWRPVSNTWWVTSCGARGLPCITTRRQDRRRGHHRDIRQRHKSVGSGGWLGRTAECRTTSTRPRSKPRGCSQSSSVAGRTRRKSTRRPENPDYSF